MKRVFESNEKTNREAYLALAKKELGIKQLHVKARCLTGTEIIVQMREHVFEFMDAASFKIWLDERIAQRQAYCNSVWGRR